MVEILKKDIEKIAQFIINGGLVAIPTETVYGIAISYNNLEALLKLKEVKERDNKPLAIMLSDKSDISKYAVVSPLAQKVIDNFLPGELTIVLDKKSTVSDEIVNGLSTVGIRVPDDKFLSELIKLTGPLVMTSANKKGENPCLSSDEVKDKLDFIDIVVRGECLNIIPTTVVEVIDNDIKILREGRMKLEDLKSVCK